MNFIRKSFLFLLVILNSGLAQEKYQLIRIEEYSTESIESLLALGLDFEGSRLEKGQFIEFVVNQSEVKMLQENGFSFQVQVDDLQNFYESRLETRSGEGFGYGSMGGYYTYAEVMVQLDSMTQNYPHLITAKYSIGQSWENREIWAIKLSDNPDMNENEPEVLFTGLHHAREPVSMMNLLYFMWHLLENYGTDPEATYLLDNRQIYVVPVVNPDGYVYNQTISPGGGGMWRKNRRNNGSSYGVDLNRNYGYKWGFDNTGSSPTPSSETYRGPSAFSEPETQVLRDFCNVHNFKNGLNYHTYSDLLIHPWAYADSHTPDSALFVQYCQIMTQYNGYTYGTPIQTVNYQVNGDANDWMYGEQTSKQKILTMTPEIGGFEDGFWPATSNIIPLCEENLFPNLFYTHVAGGYVHISGFSFSNDHNGYPDPGEDPELIITVQNIGLSHTEYFEVSFYSDNPNITFTNETVSFAALASQQQTDNSSNPVTVHLSPNLTPGQEINLNYYIKVNNQILRSDQISIIVGTPSILFSDDAENGNTNFSFYAGWGLSSSQYFSSSHSFTESPTGNYPNYADIYMTSNYINLQGTNTANLQYRTKWDIEDSWDFATIEINVQGSTNWTQLIAPGMQQGSGSGVQGTGEYGYDGTQGSWIQENIDLSAYTGNSIRLRFRLESDSYIERDGWYLDDINILYYPPADTSAPIISNLQLVSGQVMPSPSGFVVSAEINDNYAVAEPTLHFKTGNKFNPIIMQNDSLDFYSAVIPNQAPGTTVKYYLKAADGQGNIAFAPAMAPDSVFSFAVHSNGPFLWLSDDSLKFTGFRGWADSRDLIVKNPGTEMLNVSLTESQVTKAENFKNSAQNIFDYSALIKKIRRNIDPTNIRFQNSNYMEGTEKVTVIVDSLNDTNNPGADIQRIDVSRSNQFGLITTTFDIYCQAPPDSGMMTIISVDLDQEFGSGVFPAPFGFNLPYFDIGSEYELVFDVTGALFDSIGIGPIAVAMNAADSSIAGIAPVSVNGNKISAGFLYSSILGGIGFDTDFNISATMLSFTQLIFPDYAPDFGHGTFGNDRPVSWISALPTQFSLAPGDSIVIPVRTVFAEATGSHQVNLDFSSNDSSAQNKTVVLDVNILENPSPDIFLPQTVINDSINEIADTSGAFIISNTGAGLLGYMIQDSTFDGADWLFLPEPLGFIDPDSSVEVPYIFKTESMQTGVMYSANIEILSTDPDEQISIVELNVFKGEISGIPTISGVPEQFLLKQNYPNPFNPSTNIEFALPQNTLVRISVFNMLGQKIQLLANQEYKAGHHRIVWDGTNSNGDFVPSGIYIIQINTPEISLKRKMILMK